MKIEFVKVNNKTQILDFSNLDFDLNKNLYTYDGINIIKCRDSNSFKIPSLNIKMEKLLSIFKEYEYICIIKTKIGNNCLAY